jgi:hypothetical protein
MKGKRAIRHALLHANKAALGVFVLAGLLWPSVATSQSSAEQQMNADKILKGVEDAKVFAIVPGSGG